MTHHRIIGTLLGLLLSTHAFADVTLQAPWVRATVKAQRATGAFMNISATETVNLIGARSNVSKITEVHEMRMENNVMKMQAIPRLEITPDKPAALRPGSYHIMLMELDKPLNPGERVELTLTFEKADKIRFEKTISAEVKPLTMKAPATDTHGHSH